MELIDLASLKLDYPVLTLVEYGYTGKLKNCREKISRFSRSEFKKALMNKLKLLKYSSNDYLSIFLCLPNALQFLILYHFNWKIPKYIKSSNVSCKFSDSPTLNDTCNTGAVYIDFHDHCLLNEQVILTAIFYNSDNTYSVVKCGTKLHDEMNPKNRYFDYKECINDDISSNWKKLIINQILSGKKMEFYNGILRHIEYYTNDNKGIEQDNTDRLLYTYNYYLNAYDILVIIHRNGIIYCNIY